MPKAVDRWDASCGHGSSTSTKILPSLTSYFARSSASASESTLMAACGWRALMARMAAPLSGMATSDHSCSGDAPLGFGSTVTIFHPVVMHLRLTSSLVSAHPTTSTRRPNQFTATSLPGRVPRDHRARPWRRPRYDRSATKTGMCALGIPRKADTRAMASFQSRDRSASSSTSRARTGRTTVSSRISTSGVTRRLCTQTGSVGAPPCDPTRT